jgi:DNA-binding LacI/PurR family transcriptional regulator
MGAIGADLLLARLDGSSAGAHSERLPVRLIERGSGERPPA